MMAICVLEESPSMEYYAQLLREVGHKVEIFTNRISEMRWNRIKTALFIFNQLPQSEHLPQDARLDSEVVGTSDVVDGNV